MRGVMVQWAPPMLQLVVVGANATAAVLLTRAEAQGLAKLLETASGQALSEKGRS